MVYALDIQTFWFIMKAFEFTVYTNNSEVSVDGKLFFLFQRRKKKYH